MQNHVYLEGYNVDEHVVSLGNYTSSSNALSGNILIPTIKITLNKKLLESFLTTTVNDVNIINTAALRGKVVLVEYEVSYGTISIDGVIESFELTSNQVVINVQTSLINKLSANGLLSSTGNDPFSLVLDLVYDPFETLINEQHFIFWSTYYKSLGVYFQCYYGSSDNKSKLQILNDIVDKSGALVGIENNKLVAPMTRNIDYLITPCSSIEMVNGNIYYFNGYAVDYFASGGRLVESGTAPIWRSSGGSNSNLQYSTNISATNSGEMKLLNFPQSQVVKFAFQAEYPISLLSIYNIDSDIFPRGRLIEYTLKGGFILGTFRAAE